MSGSISLPTPFNNATHYAWTETQQAANYENAAQPCNTIITQMDSVMYNQTLNRCDIAEHVGLVTQQTYAIQAAGG